MGLKGWFYLQGRKDLLPNDCSSFLVQQAPPAPPAPPTHWKALKVFECRIYRDQVIVLTDLGSSRSEVEPWRGASIGVAAHQRVSIPEDGIVYWDDLKGRQVVTLDGFSLGIIDHLYCAGASDIAAIKGAYAVDIPLVEDFIDIRKVSKDPAQMIVLQVSKDHILPLVNGGSELPGEPAP